MNAGCTWTLLATASSLIWGAVAYGLSKEVVPGVIVGVAVFGIVLYAWGKCDEWSKNKGVGYGNNTSGGNATNSDR